MPRTNGLFIKMDYKDGKLLIFCGYYHFSDNCYRIMARRLKMNLELMSTHTLEEVEDVDVSFTAVIFFQIHVIVAYPVVWSSYYSEI